MMMSRKKLESLSNLQILGLALLKIYIAICIDLLIAALVIGLCEIVYPLIY